MAYTLIDLFAGCGGLTAGFAAASEFEPIFAVENDRDAAETYELNFGEHLARYADGCPMNIEDVHEGIPKADVVVGGPPCQGFSPLNMSRVDLGRRDLWQEYEKILAYAEADVFVMENVPELLRSGEYKLFLSELEARDQGWQVKADVLNAADFGVPQTRRRAIVIGSRLGEPPWPERTHYPPDKTPLGKESWKTFRDAVKGLPLKPHSKNWHSPRNPRPVSLERYMTIPNEGEGRFDLAARRPDITPDCWLRKKPARPTCSVGSGGIGRRSPSGLSSTSRRRGATCIRRSIDRSRFGRLRAARRSTTISSSRRTSR